MTDNAITIDLEDRIKRQIQDCKGAIKNLSHTEDEFLRRYYVGCVAALEWLLKAAKESPLE